MDKNTYTLTSKFECCGKTMVTVIIEGRAASVLSEFEYNTIIETERKYYQDKIKSRAGNLTRVATEYQYVLNEINTVKNKYIIVSFEKDWWENIPYGLAGREVLFIPIEDKGTSKYWSLCIKILGLKNMICQM